MEVVRICGHTLKHTSYSAVFGITSSDAITATRASAGSRMSSARATMGNHRENLCTALEYILTYKRVYFCKRDLHDLRLVT